MTVARVALVALLGLLALVPLAAAQPPPRAATIGFLATIDAGGPPAAFVEGLSKLGYQQSRNLTIDFRSARGRNDELPRLAAELVSRKPDVLVGPGTPAALALKRATASIPIVMLSIGNPIATGLIQSFARPGANVTGTANASEELASKRMQTVAEVLPGIRCLLVLRNPANSANMAPAPAAIEARKQLGIEAHYIDAATPEQLDQVLAAPLDDRCKAALLLLLDPLFNQRRAQIAEFALLQKIPLFAPFREDAEAGALMSFGVNRDEQWRLGATYVDRILKGAKPADLPVQRPTRFEMVVNLKTAKALGLVIPPAILAQVDKVIE